MTQCLQQHQKIGTLSPHEQSLRSCHHVDRDHDRVGIALSRDSAPLDQPHHRFAPGSRTRYGQMRSGSHGGKTAQTK